MLRYHKFKYSEEEEEFGSAENKADFRYIRKYSPLHNIRETISSETEYPPLLMLAAENDERAAPCHSLKFTAELQHTLKKNQFQKNPALLRVYKGVGHGLGSSVLQQIKEATDELTFLHQTLN